MPAPNSDSNSNVNNITNRINSVAKQYGITKAQATKLLVNRPGPSRRHKRAATAAPFPSPVYKNGSNRAGQQVLGSQNLVRLLAEKLKNDNRGMAIFRSLSRMHRNAGSHHAAPATFDRRATRTQSRAMTRAERNELGVPITRPMFLLEPRRPTFIEVIPADKLEHFTREELLQAIGRALVNPRTNVNEFLDLVKRARWGILLSNKNSKVARELAEVMEFINSFEGVFGTRFWQLNHQALMQGLLQRRPSRYTLYVIALFLRVNDFTAQELRRRRTRR